MRSYAFVHESFSPDYVHQVSLQAFPDDPITPGNRTAHRLDRQLVHSPGSGKSVRIVPESLEPGGGPSRPHDRWCLQHQHLAAHTH